MSHLPDITEGAAVRLAAWLDQYDSGETATLHKLMADIDVAVWHLEKGTAWSRLEDVRIAVDSLMAHLDEREVA